MISKKEIRKSIKEKKSKLSPLEIENNSKIIIKELITSDEYKNSKKIFSYVSFNQEVVTKNLLKDTFTRKKIAVPKIVDNQMVFYYIESLDELDTGIKGILEPKNTANSNIAIPEEGDLFLVPGLAFDLNKNRIGYGRGYYDKYFNKYKDINFHKIALAFDFQIIETIPADNYDVTLDGIITEKRLVN